MCGLWFSSLDVASGFFKILNSESRDSAQSSSSAQFPGPANWSGQVLSDPEDNIQKVNTMGYTRSQPVAKLAPELLMGWKIWMALLFSKSNLHPSWPYKQCIKQRNENEAKLSLLLQLPNPNISRVATSSPSWNIRNPCSYIVQMQQRSTLRLNRHHLQSHYLSQPFERTSIKRQVMPRSVCRMVQKKKKKHNRLDLNGSQSH